MKNLLLSILFVLNFIVSAHATDVSLPTTYTTNGSVTAVNLNGNFTAIAQKINGGLDNDNADTTNGYRFFETKSTLPSAGTQGRTIFLTSDNTLNLDTGSAYVKAVVVTGSPSANQVPVYSGSAWVPTSTTNLGFTSGMIMLWSGSIASIPSGWVLCNGSNGTPDLRDRFVMGAGSTYSVGGTGGAATVNLQHNHSGFTGASVTGSTGGTVLVNTNATEHRHSISNDLSTAQSVLNPYYALAFIMKT